MTAKKKLALAALLVVGTAAAGPLPVTLTDPVRGGETKLDAGAAALHVVFFATWCPPCMEEMDRLRDLSERWEDRGYRLVLIAVATRHRPDRLAELAARERPPGTLLFDAEDRARRAFGADELPAHVVLDARGREVARAGALGDEIERALRQLLGRPLRDPKSP